ncbi:MAG: NAD-dependent epimerase/dehydratase family protein [Bacteroidaceae bacterium]|nr:NAD-dependent epimerase/dehydratase family protein [Bacteroidaceae bacterium]
MPETLEINLPIHHIILEDISSIIPNQKIKWDKLQSKTVLITGASGLIGSYLVYSLLGLNEVKNTNIKILALVRNRSKAEKQFGKLLERDDIILIDKDVTEYLDYSEEIHYIIHTASTTSPKAMMEDPVGTISANMGGTQNLLELAEKHDSVFMFLSSREIYGNTLPDISRISETEYGTLDPTLVRSCYPESKRLSETMCAAYHHQYNIETKVARLAHTYGPDWNLGSGRVWGDFLQNEVRVENIVLKSDGLSELSFIYVADAVSALYFILLNAEEMVYNVSDSKGVVQVRELAHLISTLHPEKGIKTVFEISDGSCYSSSKMAILDTTKIEGLGWYPSISLREGLLRSAEVFSDILNTED